MLKLANDSRIQLRNGMQHYIGGLKQTVLSNIVLIVELFSYSGKCSKFSWISTNFLAADQILKFGGNLGGHIFLVDLW